MPGPRPAVRKPTPEEFFGLVNSPFVKIFVGSRAEPYKLPRDLISHYSCYFAGAFRAGAFKEGREMVLRLPDEKPKFFDVFVDYIRSGSATLEVPYTEQPNDLFAYCYDFIEFCDRYDICEVASVLAKTMAQALDDRAVNYLSDVPSDAAIGETSDETYRDQFVFIFSRLHEDNPVLRCLSRFLAKSLCESRIRAEIEDLIKVDNRIAAAVMRAWVDMTYITRGDARTLLRDAQCYEAEN